MVERPAIPIRTSSKRRAQSSLDDNDDEALAMMEQRTQLNKRAKEARKRLKPKHSFDARYVYRCPISILLADRTLIFLSYWNDRSLITKDTSESLNLTYKLSEREYIKKGHGDRQAWRSSSEARELMEQQRATELERRVCDRQAAALNQGTLEQSVRRTFIKLWTAAKDGLNITVTAGAGRRNSRMQSNFRQNLIDVSKSHHPDPELDTMWCPIRRIWTYDVRAAHLFAYHHGQEMMTSIFGVDAIGELFSTRNGIIMSAPAEERFDKGLFVLVPDVDSTSQHSVDIWNASTPKEYKIRVLNKDDPLMQRAFTIDGPKQKEKWIDLDGRRVAFRSDHRPRARYLYFHYCCSVLRRSWNHNQHWDHLRNEIKNNLWATPGPYLRKAMLAAIAEELGHGLENAIMQGCKDPDSPMKDIDETALVCVNDQIRVTSRSDQEDESEKSHTILVERDDEDEDEDFE